MICHGSILPGASYKPISEFKNIPNEGFDFSTVAASKPAIDLTSTNPGVIREKLTYQHRLRPLLTNKCVSCHSGPTPSGDLTFESEYSSTGNFPKGKFAGAEFLRTDYASSIPVAERVPAFNWSPAHKFIHDRELYANTFNPSGGYAPVGELAPWDPGYQALFMADSKGYYFLTDYEYLSHLGRGGSFSQTSFLLEVLLGTNVSQKRDYTGTYSHVGMISESDAWMIRALIDNGFPYMSNCSDKIVPSGPNAGKPWGDPIEVDYMP